MLYILSLLTNSCLKHHNITGALQISNCEVCVLLQSNAEGTDCFLSAQYPSGQILEHVPDRAHVDMVGM
jgi:hypothetical protein